MIGNKFYINISSLNKKELFQFLKFSKSSFFNKDADIIYTLELYKKNNTHFKNLLESEELMYSKLFPSSKKYDRKKLIKHFYACEKLFENFIIFYIPSTQKEEKFRILSDFYTKKNIKKKALSTNAKLISIVEEKKIDYKTYFHLFNLNLKRFDILLNDFDYETFQYVEKALLNLDKYYFLEKINIKQQLLTDTIMSSRKYDFILLDEIKNEIKKNPDISEKLLFKISLITLDLYQSKVDKETFFVLKNLINSNLEKFSFSTKKTFLADIGNYLSILYSKTADNDLLIEVFNNYKNQLKYKTLLNNQSLPDANFAQIIRVCIFLKEYVWANDFILNYKSALNNKDLVLLSTAEIHYSQKEYDNVIETLNKVDLTSTKHAYELKTLYAKTLYDTKEYSLLRNHLNTFEIYLRRQKKISKKIQQSNLDFVLYFKRLLYNRVATPKLKRLKKEIEADTTVFNRNWLLEKLNMLV